MDHFAGLDVSVKETSVCIVDDTGKIVREVTHAVIAGGVAVLTGFAPEKWIEQALHAIHVPEQMRQAFDYRIALQRAPSVSRSPLRQADRGWPDQGWLDRYQMGSPFGCFWHLADNRGTAAIWSLL